MDKYIYSTLDSIKRQIDGISEKIDNMKNEINDLRVEVKNELNDFRVETTRERYRARAETFKYFVTKEDFENNFDKNMEKYIINKSLKVHRGTELIKNIVMILNGVCPYALIMFFYYVFLR
jgi:hypothetical protein